uniref:Uncharacterized protein n=1 Tax=Myoviridae sp. ctisV53 TaxID=2825156 RepID=A0A8S5PND1_9CAUD|nr:MAG TPA: hypothetical protein [Myoviridae sp. ctisV53]DAE49474.1 MAG TPA: hypothetical protein [Bacteriophage sp.]
MSRIVRWAASQSRTSVSMRSAGMSASGASPQTEDSDQSDTKVSRSAAASAAAKRVQNSLSVMFNILS